MKTSVAICTYNGAKYIEEQLRSIVHQTHRVNEIVVFDDGSTGGTLEIVEKVRRETPEINFNISLNKPNIGVCANFDKAIHQCTGDIIFLSDQDDVWLKNKVETVLDWLETHPQMSVVLTNGYFINSQGESFTDKKTFDAVGLNEEGLKYFNMGFALEMFLLVNSATGAAMAFRKSFIPEFKIVTNATPGDNSPLHDEVIALTAVAKGVLGLIEEPLFKYRIHSSQQVGIDSIEEAPDTSRGIEPVMPKPSIIEYDVIPADVKDRALFGDKRFKYRDSFLSYKVLTHAKEYKRVYQKLWFKALSWDIMVANYRQFKDIFGHNSFVIRS